MRISKEQFKQLYDGTSGMDSMELLYTKPKNDYEVVEKYLPDKLWRINNLYKIVDKYGKLSTFNMNYPQHIFMSKILKHPKNLILKSRQTGISTFSTLYLFDDTTFKSNFTGGIMSLGINESKELLKKIKVMHKYLDNSIKEALNLKITTDNTEEFTYAHDSSIIIRVSFRSFTLHGLLVSELAKLSKKFPDRAEEIISGSLQAVAMGNFCTVESTAEYDSLFQELWGKYAGYTGKLTPKDFNTVFISMKDDPDCSIDVPQEITDKDKIYFDKLAGLGYPLSENQKNFWIAEKRELGERVYQEYPCTPDEAFQKENDGCFYARLFNTHIVKKNRIVSDLYNPKIALQCATDLGVRDYTVLVFFQYYNGEYRILRDFMDTNKPISYFSNVIRSILRTDLKSPYEEVTNLDYLILPHDGKKYEQTSGLTRKEAFIRDGFNPVRTLPRPPSFIEDLEKVRQAIPKIIIDKKANHSIEMFLKYTKIKDKATGLWRPQPKKDRHDHVADAVRVMVAGALDLGQKGDRIRKTKAFIRSLSTGGLDI